MNPSRRIKGTSGNDANVNKYGALHVINHSYPPDGLNNIEFPFVQSFAESDGNTLMNVDGSTTHRFFVVSSVPDYDIYISQLHIIIGDDGSPALNEFGDLVELTNGTRCLWFVSPEGEVVLRDNMKTSRDVIRFGNKTIGIGDGAGAYLADVSGGATEKAYLPIVDLCDMFKMQHGLKLAKGSADKIIFIIRDNLTALTRFDVIATGKKIK